MDETGLIAIVAATIAGGMRLVESLIAKALPRKIQLSDDEHRWLSRLHEHSIKSDEEGKNLLKAMDRTTDSINELSSAIRRFLGEPN